jgi:hypothetical protein
MMVEFMMGSGKMGYLMGKVFSKHCNTDMKVIGNKANHI